MEETVITNEGGANVFAFAPEAPVDAEQSEAVTENTVEQTEVDAPSETQADIGRAFAAERKRIEAKYAKQLEQDPMRALGKLMVDDLMNSGNMTQEEAVQKATDNFLAAVSKRDNLPTHVVRRLMQTDKKESNQEQVIDDIIDKLRTAEKPQGFDEQSAYADEEFQQMLLEMPVDKAIRLYHAEHTATAQAKQDIAEKMRARQSIPQTIVPQQPAAPVADWRNVSTDDFFKEKERRRKLY